MVLFNGILRRHARAADPHYASVGEMIELIHALNKSLEPHDKSNQLLQQQIESNQKINQRRGRLARIIMYVIAIGIVVPGNSAGSIMDTMTGYMQTMGSSVLFMSEHANDMETSLDTMSDDAQKDGPPGVSALDRIADRLLAYNTWVSQ